MQPNPDLLETILKRVSRSFFLSLKILPRSLRHPIGLAYLLARAADTIADTALISREKRLAYLELFRRELRGGSPSSIPPVQEALTGPQRTPGERELLVHLEDCFTLYRGLEKGDRERVARLLLTLTQGMIMDLTTFPGEDAGKVVALKARSDLDGYTYYVAGCVGEFWTEMVLTHRPSFAGWDREGMKERGIRFGKGLQLTNILRDLAKDLRIGRCYLPEEDLRALGVAPEELLDKRSITRIRPLIGDLLALTLDHYQEGWGYTLALPRREVRIRLACAWPLLIGLKTLALIEASENLLDPDVTVKIPRTSVYGLILSSALLVCSNVGLNRYYQHLCRAIPLEGVNRWTSP